MATFSTKGLKVYITLESAATDPWATPVARTPDTNNPAHATHPGVLFCINSISRDVTAGEAITVGTFCDPSAQVAGDQTAGTLSWGGPIDFCDPGYVEMHAALIDAQPHSIIIEFPAGIGHMIMDVDINSFAESFELNAAAVWTGGAVVRSAPEYFPAACA